MGLHHFSLPDRAGDKRYWGNLLQSGQAYAIATAAQADDQPLLVVTADSASATKLQEELSFYLSDESSIQVQVMPDWEVLPYDTFSPHQDIISERLTTLAQLPVADKGEHKLILLVSVVTLLHRLCPTQYILGNSLSLQIGSQFDVEVRRRQFEQAGYRCVDSVSEHGEFAIRGAIVDVFPMGAAQPYRIDLFDDEIETLRTFDPETQRSVEQVQAIELLPGHEFPMDAASLKDFRQRFCETFDVNHRDCPIYQDVNQNIASPGIEYYLPLFFEHTAALFDYLPASTRVLVYESVDAAITHFWQELQSRYDSRRVDPLRPLLPPAQVVLPEDQFYQQLKQWPQIWLCEQSVSSTGQRKKAGRIDLNQQPLPELTMNARLDQPLRALQGLIDETAYILLVAESAGRREILLELLKQHGIKPTACANWAEFIEQKPALALTTGLLQSGLLLPEQQIAVVPEALLLGQRVQQSRRRQSADSNFNHEQVIRNLTELSIGAPVVHIDHGVGRYQGLETLTIDRQTNEFVALSYANEAKLYVPVASLHLISRYNGADDELAPLHRLGSEQWRKVRRKAAEKARDVAAELLDIYARREARKGFGFAVPDHHYLTFANAFAFEETPDQQQAIEAVIKDMTTAKPMDRLVCGDVGFGKTEVAMRAAFLATHGGKQVAILVPTTLLAQQHYESFKDRFADWPVEVEVMSRFKSAKAIAATKERLQSGQLDIVIGTHKLLQDDLKFKELGLLIIDEEHRFGVRHKEKLKSLRSEVDILTLTATPIPRTLNMAMSGMRDLSIIATPPARRLSVKTFVRQYDLPLVKEAILRELLRGGQVYYLHNQVDNIEQVADELQALIPEARVAVGHGQMRERQLEQVMSDFYHKRFNVLVCTTIIETGIDVPNANTIVINRADKFGLAQLHQLRGRVGRSHHQAYAYLLTPSPKVMTNDAQKRLEAITEAQTLGAGFMLASNDLEIRGAGELLGEGQSGQIQSVGFSLYTDMLERAVQSIRDGKTPDVDKPLSFSAEVNLRLPALLPEDYIHDVHTRLMLYKRIAAAQDNEALNELQVELIDRFGLLPEPSKHLFRLMQLKFMAQVTGIQKLEAGPKEARIEFEEQPNVDPLHLIQLMQAQPQRYRLEGSTVLRYIEDMDTAEQRFSAIEGLLKTLQK